MSSEIACLEEDIKKKVDISWFMVAGTIIFAIMTILYNQISSNSKDIVDLKVALPEIKADLRNVATGVDDLKRGLGIKITIPNN